jgi:hypothetical protein
MPMENIHTEKKEKKKTFKYFSINKNTNAELQNIPISTEQKKICEIIKFYDRLLCSKIKFLSAHTMSVYTGFYAPPKQA